MWAQPTTYLKIKTILVSKLPFWLVAIETSLSYQNGQFCQIFMKLWIKPKQQVAMVYITQMVLKLALWVFLWYKIMIMALIALCITTTIENIVQNINGKPPPVRRFQKRTLCRFSAGRAT